MKKEAHEGAAQKVIEVLMEDHNIVLEQVSEFRATLLDFYEGALNNPEEKFSPFISFFKNDLPVHIKREEKDLLPLHEKLFPSAPRYRIILKHEHDLIQKVFQRFHRALKNLNLPGTNEKKLKAVMLESGLTLVSLLRDHTTFEDHILFPELLEN